MSAPRRSCARLAVRCSLLLAGGSLGVSASGAPAPSPLQAAQTQAAGLAELGGGPLAALAARMGADTPPAPAARALAPWPRWEEPAWDEEAPWRRWSELVRALAPSATGAGTSAAESAERARRAPADASAAEQRPAGALAAQGSPTAPALLHGALAACALAQGRHDDAWQHLARADDPGLFAALLPHLLPGVPLEHEVLAGGVPAPLPDGALLAPALPPAPAEDQPFAPCEMRSAPFVVGDATLDLRVFFEPGDGVQLDLAWLAGGAATIAVRLPCPLEASIARVYLDWDELPAPEPIVRVTLSAEAPEVSLWANLAYRPPAFARGVPAALPSAFAQAGVRAASDAAPRARRFAAVLAELLGIPLASEPGDGRLAPLELRAAAALELGALVSAAERFLLAAPDAAPAPALEKAAESRDER